jgi:hypothetical protein
MTLGKTVDLRHNRIIVNKTAVSLLSRKRVSLRNYLETRFLVINVNFCYRGLEKFALVGLKLLGINLCCYRHHFYPVADYSCC